MTDAVAGVPPPWNPEDDDRLVCRAIRAETHDVKTFVFGAPEPRLFRFAPGQFLTLELSIDGATVHRCYTIASPPTRPFRVEITVKRQPGGVVSPWLHERLRIGDTIRAVGPMGDFSTGKHQGGKYLFLSGGSGVTPLMSMTRAAHDLAEDRDIVFVHCARTPEDIIFPGEVGRIAGRTAFVVETAGGSWPGFRGRLTRTMLDVIAPDLREREVFCCGPAPYMAGVRSMLSEAGYPMARYREESFLFENHAELEPIVAADSENDFRITFTKSGRIVRCNSDTTILSAAAAAGLRLPSSCTKGMCGTCKSRKLSGIVEMRHGGGIRQREVDQGLVLLCCSRPMSDVEIDR